MLESSPTGIFPSSRGERSAIQSNALTQNSWKRILAVESFDTKFLGNVRRAFELTSIPNGEQNKLLFEQ